MPEHDPWAGTSGLRDDFDGTIVSAKFIYDSEYFNGDALLMTMEVTPDDGGEPEILKLSVGKGWDQDAKGAKAKREDNSDPKGFNKSTNYFRFCAAALETDFAPTLRENVPWDASIWEGQNFHFNRLPFPNFDPAKEPTEVTCPTVYNGAGEAEEKPAKKAPASTSKKAEPTAAEKAKAKAAAAKAAAAKGDEAVDAGDPNVEILKQLAVDSGSHDEFIEKAYAALDDGDAYEDSIVDDSFYNEHHA